MKAWLTQWHLMDFSFAIVMIIAGFVIAKLASSAFHRLIKRRVSTQQGRLFKRIVFYALILMFIISALQQVGFKLGVLLGAAGVFSIAVSFASQTTFANFISGLFLILEKPFDVGDYLKVNGSTGEVLSIDLLSTKIRTFDNTLMRIPNEMMIKNPVQNLTFYRDRRLDILVGVAYPSDLPLVQKTLLECTLDCEGVLHEPESKVRILNFADSSITCRLSVYVDCRNVLNVQSALIQRIQQQFADADIEIPYPQIGINPGSDQLSLPVKTS